MISYYILMLQLSITFMVALSVRATSDKPATCIVGRMAADGDLHQLCKEQHVDMKAHR